MTRKTLSILVMVAALVAAIALVACGGGEAPAAEPAAPAATAAPAAAAEAPTAAPPAQAATAPEPTAAPTEAAAGAAPASVPTVAAMPAVTPADSCAPSADLTFDNRPTQGGTLVRLFADPPTLDPHLAGDVTSSVIINEVFGGLVTLSLDYQPVLDLAESCSVSEDGMVYTFVLRENAQFHDGRPVTAHDVKWSIERASDPETLSARVQDYLGDIVGVDDKLLGNASEVRGARVIDDRTIDHRCSQILLPGQADLSHRVRD